MGASANTHPRLNGEIGEVSSRAGAVGRPGIFTTLHLVRATREPREFVDMPLTNELAWHFASAGRA
jgi:hypothetical protein